MGIYTYAATIVSVHDGDTIYVDLDHGRRIWSRNAKHRLAGCNARELDKPGGPEARDNLARLLPAGLVVTLKSLKPYKYGADGGEYMAQVTLPHDEDLVTGLIADEWAAAWDGRGAAPVPPWPRSVH